ncbi:MAG: hypothetical protein FWG46_04255 [Treponema sp.]|nr:hypothetical protein [Treponema sp.]
MKRLCQILVFLCVLLCMACGPTIEEDPLGPDFSGSDPIDNETVTPSPDPDPGEYETEEPGPDPQIPELRFLGCIIVSEKEIDFVFSGPVQVVSLDFDPVLTIESVNEGSTVTVYLEEGFRWGIPFTADITAEDEWGNELAVQVLFETEAPPLVFLAAEVASETEICFEFSVPVQVISLAFNPGLSIESIEEGSTVAVRLAENLAPGLRLECEIAARDEFGKTINVQIPFFIRNYRVPQMVINELRTEFSRPRSEFIEFKMITAGNLGALRVYIAGNYRAPMVYEFLPVEVQAGEYVVLHLRTLDDECRDEYGSDLAESGGTDSSPDARDFWIPGSAKLLHKTDAVYVADQDDRVLDAVMIAEAPDAWWNRDYFAAAAEFLFAQGAWKSPAGGVCAPADAASSAKIGSASTRSISRDETVPNTSTAADWYVTITGGATPGQPNNPNRFN